MGNTDEKKEKELKKIPRNPNIPVKDDEIEALLKKANEQIGEKKEEKRENISLSNASKAGMKEKDKVTKPEIDKPKVDKPKVDKPKDSKPNTNRVSQTEKKKVSDKPAVDFQIEDDVYVTGNTEKKKPQKNYNMTPGEIIGAIFEGIWTGIKLIVLVTIVTAIVGFFMSRDMMIRGRSGEMLSKQNMQVAATALSTEKETKEDGREWTQDVELVKLTLEADDGKILIARKVVADKANENWVVILHGQNEKMDDIYDIAKRYVEEGYNVLLPDLRAHGESEGSFYGMGWLDRLDVINWIDVILEDTPSANVVIHGVDLGADTALMLAGEPLKDSIKGIVAEGAYTTAWDAMKQEYKARHEKWPVFPMLHMMNPVMKVWAGYSLTEADAVEQVKKTSLPILLIHGANDTYVTEDMVEELDQAIASPHEVVTISTGTHGDCRFAEPDRYYEAVFRFVEEQMK